MAWRSGVPVVLGVATFGCARGSGPAATPRVPDPLISEAITVGGDIARNATSLDLDVKNTTLAGDLVFHRVGSENPDNITVSAASQGPGEDIRSTGSNPGNPYDAVVSRRLNIFGQQGTLQECADTSNFCGNWSGDCDTLFCDTCLLKETCDTTCQVILPLSCPSALESGCFMHPDDAASVDCRLDLEPPCRACDLHFSDVADYCPDCQMTSYCLETCGTTTRTTTTAAPSTTGSLTTSTATQSSTSITSATQSSTSTTWNSETATQSSTSITSATQSSTSTTWSSETATQSSTSITSAITGSAVVTTSAATQSIFKSVTTSSLTQSSVTSVTTSLTTRSSVSSLTASTSTRSSLSSVSSSVAALLVHGKVTIVLPPVGWQAGQVLPAVAETLANVVGVPAAFVVVWQADDNGDSSYVIGFNISASHDASEEIPTARSIIAALVGASAGDFAEKLLANLEEIGLGDHAVQVSGVEATCAAKGCGDEGEALPASLSVGSPNMATQEEAMATTVLVVAVAATACFCLLLALVALLAVRSRRPAVDMAPPSVVVVAVGKGSDFNPRGTTISITTDDPEAKVVEAAFDCEAPPPHRRLSADTVDIMGGATRGGAPARVDLGGLLLGGGLLTSGKQPQLGAAANLGAQEAGKGDASPGPSPQTSPRRGWKSSGSSSRDPSTRHSSQGSWVRLPASGSSRSELPAVPPRSPFRGSQVREGQVYLTPRRASAGSRVDGQDKWIDCEGCECERL